MTHEVLGDYSYTVLEDGITKGVFHVCGISEFGSTHQDIGAWNSLEVANIVAAVLTILKEHRV